MYRLIYKTLSVVWLAMHEAVALTQEPTGSKRTMCQIIIDQVETKVRATTFHDTISKVQEQWASEGRRLTHATKARVPAARVHATAATVIGEDFNSGVS